MKKQNVTTSSGQATAWAGICIVALTFMTKRWPSQLVICSDGRFKSARSSCKPSTDNDAKWTESAPGFPLLYWNAAAANYVYVWALMASIGVDIVGESQLTGYPSMPSRYGLRPIHLQERMLALVDAGACEVLVAAPSSTGLYASSDDNTRVGIISLKHNDIHIIYICILYI